METLMAISDLQVDRIIEQVLIRPPTQPYNYAKSKDKALPQQHLWHFQLQEENRQLKEKIKSIKLKCKRKEDTLLKEEQLQREVLSLKRQIDEVLYQNQTLQRDINRLRIRNSQINESIQQQIQDSNRSKNKRQCSCVQASISKQSPMKKQHRRAQTVLIENSPQIQRVRQTKNVSINCHLPIVDHQEQIQKRMEHIRNMKRIIENQKALISSYQNELNAKEEPPTLDKRTITSISRFQPMERPSSLKTFKAQSSVGSIVKVKRQ